MQKSYHWKLALALVFASRQYTILGFLTSTKYIPFPPLCEPAHLHNNTSTADIMSNHVTRRRLRFNGTVSGQQRCQQMTGFSPLCRLTLKRWHWKSTTCWSYHTGSSVYVKISVFVQWRHYLKVQHTWKCCQFVNVRLPFPIDRMHLLMQRAEPCVHL